MLTQQDGRLKIRSHLSNPKMRGKFQSHKRRRTAGAALSVAYKESVARAIMAAGMFNRLRDRITGAT